MTEWIMTAPVISTTHITPETDEWLLHNITNVGVNLQPFSPGWLLYTGGHEGIADLPADLGQVLDWATRKGFAWVRLDPAGGEIAELPAYTWE